MDFAIVNTCLTAVGKIINTVKDNATNFYTTKSLSEAAKLTRVEPLTILSKDLLNLEYMPDVNNTLLSIFTGYYLQAVNILSKVNDVEVVRMLDRLNPDRDSTGFLLENSIANESLVHMSMETYKYSLPTKLVPAMEDNDAGKTINEISNLSVGKHINVTIGFDKNDESGKNTSVTIPVNVRLLASVIPNATITQLLTYKSEDNSLTERYHAWRSGRIGFIKDLIFCQDLIDEWKKASISDDTNTIQEIMRRVNNSKKYGLLTHNPSLVSASNIFVISEEVAREVENKLGGKLSNHHVREKAFDNTYAMIIAVVDREYERVTFYTRGLSASTDVSIKEIKAASKSSKGPDMMDMMKMMSMGAGSLTI